LDSTDFWEAIVYWVIIQLIIQGVLYLLLSWYEQSVFKSHTYPSAHLKKGSISILTSIFFFITIGLLGMVFENTLNWSESGHIVTFTGIFYLYSLIFIVLGIKYLIHQFDLIRINIFLLFVFACIQLHYITFWAISDLGKIIPTQQTLLVQGAYQDMYLWFFGLLGLNIIIVIVNYIQKPEYIKQRWKSYLFMLIIAFLQEAIVPLGMPEFFYGSTYNNLSIVFNYGPNLVVMMILVGLLIYILWVHNPFREYKKNDVL
jgi:hypothetical protein